MTTGALSDQTDEQEVTGSLPQRSKGGAEIREGREGCGLSGDQLSSSSSSSSAALNSSSTSSEARLESESQPAATEDRGSSTGGSSGPEQDAEQDNSARESEAGARLVQADVHASLENGEKEPPSSSPSSDEQGADSERRSEEEDNDEDGSRKEDYSEGDLVDISAYSGLGEDDSGGSQLDDEEDEEDEEAYQPESSCSEIAGLPEEEEPAPPNRKIRFSTDSIKVSVQLLKSTCKLQRLLVTTETEVGAACGWMMKTRERRS